MFLVASSHPQSGERLCKGCATALLTHEINGISPPVEQLVEVRVFGVSPLVRGLVQFLYRLWSMSSSTSSIKHPRQVSLMGLVHDNRGANLVEYIILVGVVALLSIASFEIFGGSVREKVTKEGEVVGHIETGN